MSTENTNFVTDMFRHTTDMVNQAVAAGVKFQEETTRFWNDTYGRNMDQFFDQMNKVGRGFGPTFRKNLQRYHRNIDEQADKGLDLVRQSFDSAEAAFDDGFMDKTMDMWRSSFDTMRSGFETMTKANAQIVENWANTTEKCFETTTGTKSSPKASDK